MIKFAGELTAHYIEGKFELDGSPNVVSSFPYWENCYIEFDVFECLLNNPNTSYNNGVMYHIFFVGDAISSKSCTPEGTEYDEEIEFDYILVYEYPKEIMEDET